MGRVARKSDGSSDAVGSEPERTCAVTRAKLAPADLIRFVCDPEGVIAADVACRLPGRGVWVTLSRKLVEEAARRNAFARSLKRPVKVPEGLAGLVETLLVRRAAEALSLANKAGLVIAGFAKVDAAVGAGEVAVLVHASDAADDGRKRLDRKLRAVATAAGETGPAAAAPEIAADLTTAELSLALGRQNVVHAALRAGGATRHFLRQAWRLRRYRADCDRDACRPPLTKSNTEQV
jgi:hypothetical protein